METTLGALQAPRKTGEGAQGESLVPDAQVHVVELIVFSLGSEEFAANIDEVREIIEMEAVVPIPDSPEFIAGVINVRGEIAVVLNIKALFALPAAGEGAPKHIVMAGKGKSLFGLMVDEVTEVLRVPAGEIKPAPELISQVDQGYLAGVLPQGKRLIVLLNIARVISEEQLTELAGAHLKQTASTENPAQEKGKGAQ